MIISPPFLPQSGLNSGNANNTDPDPLMTAIETYEPGCHGVFPITFDRRWHGGIHLVPETLDEPVRAVADGEVVAYRISQQPISDGHIDEATGKEALNTNTGFLLLRHVTDTGDGRSLTFYSLYMHLLDLMAQQSLVAPQANPSQNSSPTALAAWLLEAGDSVKQGNGKKVYRKDILGHWGQSQGMRHLHFEIFMTEADFTAWFDQSGHTVQLGAKNPVQPTSNDWWGHAYYVIPGSVQFLDVPDGIHDALHFPTLGRGQLPKDSSKLYVEAYFHKGQRYTCAWLDENGDGTPVLMTPQPIRDRYDDYEYKLCERAKALYSTCPSDGYELLRFGRILSQPPTLVSAQEKATWVAVPFDANGTQGYVDINKTTIVKLSDADFPFFTGWQKIDGETAPLDAGGLFSYRKLRQLVGDATAAAYDVPQTDPQFSLDAQLSSYVQGSSDVRSGLSGFVCHTKSEWDSTNNDERYQDLNKPDGYFGKSNDSDPDGYEKFQGFLKKIQFMDQVSALAGEKKFWFFHPLAFIRHFRKCSWLNVDEMARAFPRSLLHLSLTQFHASTTTWNDAHTRARTWVLPFNQATRKYGVSASRQRLLHFFSHVVPETGNLHYVREIQGETKSYNPYYGRGLIQLTHLDNYLAYGHFRKFPTGGAPPEFSGLGWDPNALIARDNAGHHNADNCVDSACFYVANRANMLSHMDAGVSQNNAITVSKDVNGYVAIENLNGLEVRLQSVLYLRNTLLDDIFDGQTVSLTFEWHRNSQQEPVLDAQGHPVMVGSPPRPKKKYYATQHTITSSLELQKP